ncbi:uncharacterized protein [Chironomus tepperi]|uniref:uncharacterized protein n=1 Tax=Chironomus tepperi TaxID=113505 RepID=UPI00391F5C75
MDILPKELLIEIFTYLPAEDLLSLSLTCHTFNELISNNSKLLENFEVQFIFDYVNNEWIGSRKYTRLFIDGSSGIYFLYILKDIGPDIVNLVINCSDFAVAYVKQILLMCENVKNLTIYNATNDSDPQDYGYPFLKYNLDYFYFRGDIDVFKLFVDCTAKELDVRRDYDDESKDVSGLKQFLKAQKDLSDLKMENFDKTSSLFGDDSLNLVNFRLKNLKLKNFDDYCSYNYWEFLDNHKESLVYLEVCFVNHEAISPFRKFRNLKTLKMYNMCSDFNELTSIETLYLKDVDGKWSEKFKNVKNLVISQNVEEIVQVESLRKLDNLKMSNCSMPTLKIPAVKRLTLKKVELESTKPFEYEDGCEIEELKIIKCKNVEWLVEFLIHKTFNLKTLVIKKSILIDDDLKFIEDYRNKIKHLEIIDCRGITAEDIDNDEDTDDDDFSSEDEDSDDEEEEEDEDNQDEGSEEDEEESDSNEDSGNEESSEHEDEEESSESDNSSSSSDDDDQDDQDHSIRCQSGRPKVPKKFRKCSSKTKSSSNIDQVNAGETENSECLNDQKNDEESENLSKSGENSKKDL